MPELSLIKTPQGLMPVTTIDGDYIQGLKVGEVVRGEFKRMRNPSFHRKYMALLNLGFDHFETQQPIEYNGFCIKPLKNFDEFRRWVAIQAGFYDVVGYPCGAVRMRAKSISFAQMNEDEFSDLYSKTIDVLLESVLNNFKDYSEVEETVEKIVRFG
ncbi:DUF1367 family protein [Pseudoalteromonas piscicida]|uniref:DUF1367 family protein n=1 Tax=Pseudoalteromonas piscicida TaxID=43662 RepID=UPI00061F9513|nr:DUF1367 family protein [Pseudoalteromonas piscicida]KJZ03270.1 hypothetical protein TW73_08965 [Pseudoalteromonas piscicida]